VKFTDRFWTRWESAKFAASVVSLLPRILPGARWNIARLLEERARKDGESTAILFEDQRYTWSEVNREVDRAARAFREIGISEGDVVVVLMDNRPEFLFAVTALNRLRAAGALVNTHIGGAALVHAIRIAEGVAVLVGQEHREKIDASMGELEGIAENRVFVQGEAGQCDAGHFRAFDEIVNRQSSEPLDAVPKPRTEDHLGYIYTSGTTGLPKAAVIANKRVLIPGLVMARGVLGLRRDDVVYVTTPLYHSVGMFIGWGSTLISGAALAVRRRFSASRFWDDVNKFDVSVFVYIGELCRYLLNQPRREGERGHRIRLAAGNGLRPDIWEEFQGRFGIPLIREYYGATEGNNMLINLTGRPGMVGRLMMGARLLRCDPETGEPLHNAEGFCESATEGEVGLYVAPDTKISPFDGYADKEATRKKILVDVFKKGDSWFNSGDLMTLHEDNWVAFADRVGDTFRWKAENVSTTEVGEILNGAPGVLETNVYGVEVPGADGRAGMASVHVGEGFSIEEFGRFAVENLASYQRPVFVRLQAEMELTVTLKHQKVGYRRDGYDPSKVGDPLYLLEDDGYTKLDDEVYAQLKDGRRVIR